MNLLDVEPLDLGPDVKAISLELVDASVDREPVRGEEAVKTWSRVIPTLAGNEVWALDFYSHLDRVRDFCITHSIKFREAETRCIVIPGPDPTQLEELFTRFEAETFGARAGALAAEGDPALEKALSRQGADAYHPVYANYRFCAICDFENGSLVVLSNKLWASEIIRLVRAVLDPTKVEARLPA
jgi:hypothetical protein